MIAEWPLWAFTILTGTACGAYIAAALFPAVSKQATSSTGDVPDSMSSKGQWAFPLVALALIAVGGLCAVAHLGRPELMFNVLNNPAAPITIEGICAGILAVVALVDVAISKSTGSSPRWVRIVGAIVGIVFIAVVTSAYVTSYGNSSWIATPTFPLFVLGDISVGCALWLAFFDKKSKPLTLVSGIIAALFVIDLIWEGAVFSSFGQRGAIAIFIGAVFALAQAVLSFLDWSGKFKASWGRAALFVCAVLALAISRYGFYMASII